MGDRLGQGLALACLGHCLLVLLALPVLPAVAAVAEDPVAEALLFFTVFAVGLVAFLAGWQRHRRLCAAALAVPGLVLIGIALTAETALGRPEWDLPLTAVGGLVLLGAHGLNLRLCRNCRRCGAGRTLAEPDTNLGLVRKRENRIS